MKEQPKFIRRFSKKNSSEERQRAAQEIMAKRKKYFSRKQEHKKRKEELEQSLSEREQILTEQLASLENLKEELVEISSSKFKKIINYLKLRKIQEEISFQEEGYGELKEKQDEEETEYQDIIEGLNNEEMPPRLQEAKEMLESFYETQRAKWETSDFSKEDIKENFSEEHLAFLSLEDYALLLKRFPSEMVTHVTRQGIRDHLGHEGHNAGEGEYFDGFMSILEDGRLHSPLSVTLMENEKEKAIAKHLYLDEWETKEEALEWLHGRVLNLQSGPGSYADSRAIHFATEEVADFYYGSERGNEIFVAYPSAFIASQYYFQGQLTEGGGMKHNDQWVWDKEGEGMKLDVGLVFIPEDTLVDKHTGSRYEFDKDNKAIKNFEYIQKFKDFINSESFFEIAKRVKDVNLVVGWYNNQEYLCKVNDISDLPENTQKKFEELEPLRQKLEEEFDITDVRLQLAILNRTNLDEIELNLRDKNDGEVNSVVEKILSRDGVLYKEAQNTINSEEFWENYFAKNPGKRPSKVIYYKGGDPTKALQQWRKEMDLRKRSEEVDMGFSEKMVDSESPEATFGMERYKILAERIIEKYYE